MKERGPLPGQNMPKLGWKDQLLYWSLIIPNMAFSLGGIFIAMLAQDKAAFSDERVIAATVGEGNLNSFYLTFWCMVAFVVLLAGFQQHRVPIFGRKDVTYGPPKYDAVYPLLRKDRPKKTLSQSQKKWRIIAAVLILGSFLFSVAMFPRSFYGRAVMLKDGTIAVYNASNELVHHYSSNVITAVQLDTYSAGRFPSWHAEIVVYTADSQSFSFPAHCFAGNELQELKNMLSMKYRFGDLVTIHGTENIEQVIQDQYSDPGEQALLRFLFQEVE
jgi:hypothetical protein